MSGLVPQGPTPLVYPLTPVALTQRPLAVAYAIAVSTWACVGICEAGQPLGAKGFVAAYLPAGKTCQAALPVTAETAVVVLVNRPMNPWAPLWSEEVAM